MKDRQLRVLPNGKTLDLGRDRWEGVLSQEEIDFCIQSQIPLGYDCAQIGWVPLACKDDFVGISRTRSETPALIVSSGHIPEIERLRTSLTRELQRFAQSQEVQEITLPELEQRLEAFTKVKAEEFSANYDIKVLDQCHCALHYATAEFIADYKRSNCEESTPEISPSFRFRKWNRRDFKTYARLLGNPKIWEYLPDEYPSPFTEDTAKQFIDVARVEVHHEVCAVDYLGETVGQVRLLFDDSYPGITAAEVAYWLGEEYWGKGLMSQILHAYTHHSFRKHQLRFIYAWIRADNEASIRTATRAGYLRDNFKHESELSELVARAGCLRYTWYRSNLRK